MTALFGLSILARLPLAMLSIGLLVHTQAATGEYGAAGLVAGAFALAQGAGGPLLGRAADRRGQSLVLAAAALISAAALIATSVLPHDVPVALRAALAVAAGTTLPPVGACFRALLPGQVAREEERAVAGGQPRRRAKARGDAAGGEARAARGGGETRVAGGGGEARVAGAAAARLRQLYAVDTAAVEVTWVAGPPVVLALGVAAGTGTALAATGVLLAASTLAFAATKASRSWTPERRDERHGAMHAPGIRTLTAMLLAVGFVFGATEVAVTAAGHAQAGPLLGLWGLGSLIAWVVASRLGGGARTVAGLILILAALGASHAALALATTPLVLGALLLIAGATIAPTFATIYAMVDAVAPRGTATEAFAWLATASASGAAIGAAVAGTVVDHAGSPAAFAVGGLSAALAAGIGVLRARTLPGAAVHTPQGATT